MIRSQGECYYSCTSYEKLFANVPVAFGKARVQEKHPLKNGAPPVRGGRTPDAKTVTALIICCTKGFVSIFVEAKRYSKAKPSEYAAIFTRSQESHGQQQAREASRRCCGEHTASYRNFGGFWGV